MTRQEAKAVALSEIVRWRAISYTKERRFASLYGGGPNTARWVRGDFTLPPASLAPRILTALSGAFLVNWLARKLSGIDRL